MMRTGRRAGALAELLRAGGLPSATAQPMPPRLNALSGDLVDDLVDIYRSFGGGEPTGSLRPGPWDIVLAGGLLLELDEELHFNRYRRATFERSWSDRVPWRQPYVDLCKEHERACLRAGSWGKRWTSPSSEAMFGAADPLGELSSRGAPRWKQRALYDAMKDAYATCSKDHRLIRVAIYDRVAGVTLGAVLDGDASVSTEDLFLLLSDRTA